MINPRVANTVYVTHRREMTRMSAPYKLRENGRHASYGLNMAIFLSNFVASKPRINILRPEMGSTPQY